MKIFKLSGENRSCRNCQKDSEYILSKDTTDYCENCAPNADTVIQDFKLFQKSWHPGNKGLVCNYKGRKFVIFFSNEFNGYRFFVNGGLGGGLFKTPEQVQCHIYNNF